MSSTRAPQPLQSLVQQLWGPAGCHSFNNLLGWDMMWGCSRKVIWCGRIITRHDRVVIGVVIGYTSLKSWAGFTAEQGSAGQSRSQRHFKLLWCKCGLFEVQHMHRAVCNSFSHQCAANLAAGCCLELTRLWQEVCCSLMASVCTSCQPPVVLMTSLLNNAQQHYY
jgi:hypothetical protein